MMSNIYEYGIKIVGVVLAGLVIYFYVETWTQRTQFQRQCIELKTQVTELQSELTAAKTLVQKNEIGELKRRWRLFQ